jgi:SpoVK/Ycf46/Vps4 family AAA+-type ATPase
MEQLKEVRTWMLHNTKASSERTLKRRKKQGYRVLFDGPSGTAKTLTAEMLAKEFNKEVYKIDLSKVVSKYIGETEKNLKILFSRAENIDAILLIDEADALFGKRTDVWDSQDRYANIEVSYLLKKIEEYPGLVILATNLKGNLDEAFIRRFQTVLHFPKK